jgi:hypothetical protein
LCVGRVVSFQVTVLKVLDGQPDGRAALADLRRAVAILMTSGPDWKDRVKCLAARAPSLDIFSQSFVLRNDAGWQITDAGRVFLASLESPAHMTTQNAPPAEAVVSLSLRQISPPVRPMAVPGRDDGVRCGFAHSVLRSLSIWPPRYCGREREVDNYSQPLEH